MGPSLDPDIRVGPEDCSKEAVRLELRFRSALLADLVADTPDSGSRLFDKLDAVHDLRDVLY
ncbi:MAG: hypothetical protein KKG10_00810 [Proteobacteria bacterium]|nr:hypothetical protein [Pseudomonadota bacterium]